ncbi:MAG: PRC-barrel domain-containing protein [Xanthobacteraceae bacterium]|nr:PRC-barrel domain-containing protein [Xanthobacteraceae bacterium]MBX3534935.1 PRC-barrel domain-containing protein [Xanthobacteraceae bacterium]MBX3549646.1 PRC-barrel domain-containing protein [Xanthobacteraceae bacterium]MCW5676869.1 PRC-barrel domain-containing protein [Xanthobacteraceae bacterium]
MKIIAPFMTTVAAAALLTAGAVAQTPPKDSKTMPQTQSQTPPATPSSPSTSASATQQAPNQWRGSQLIGLDVYNSANENIGDINDVILGKDGKIELIVVGVGGWLGMGEHDVALRWDQVSFSDQPPKGGDAKAEQGEKPDHAMVSMTKEQLKAMPAFKYSSQSKT